MTIRLKCPKCQAPLTAPPEMAGRKAKCRVCAAVLQIPDPELDRWPPGMAPPKKTAPPAETAPRQKPPPAANKSPPPAAAQPPVAKPVEPAVAKPAKPAVAKPVLDPAAATPVHPPPPSAGAAPDSTPPRATPVAPAKPSSAPPPRAKEAAAVSAPIPPAEPPSPPVDDISELLDFEPVAPRKPSPTAPQIDANPYRSPAGDQPALAAHSAKQVRFGQLIGTTWRIYKANLGMCVAGVLLGMVCMGMTYSLGQAALVFVLGKLIEATGSVPVFVVFLIVMAGFMLALGTFFLLGVLRFMLPIARGERGEIGDLFSAGPLMLRGTVLSLLMLFLWFLGNVVPFGIVIFIAPLGGFWLFIPVGILSIAVPVLLMLLLGLTPIAFVDQSAGIIEPFQVSIQTGGRNLLTFFLVIVAIGGGLFIVDLITFGLAMLLTVPFRALCYAVVYLMATGQQVGDPG